MTEQAAALDLKVKPTLAEVVEYSERSIEIAIRRMAQSQPPEVREELRQEAMLRLVEAYPRLEPGLGWKAFVQQHAGYAIKDYLRAGEGFEEQKSRTDTDEEGVPLVPRLRHRVTVIADDGDRVCDVEEIAAFFGVHQEDEGDELSISPRWELVAKLASRDEDVHLVAKILMGCSQEELRADFGVSRERLSQRIREFFARIENARGPGVDQIKYAFGMCELFGLPDCDTGYGHDFEPVDLWDSSSVTRAKESLQPLLFPSLSKVIVLHEEAHDGHV